MLGKGTSSWARHPKRAPQAPYNTINLVVVLPPLLGMLLVSDDSGMIDKHAKYCHTQPFVLNCLSSMKWP